MMSFMIFQVDENNKVWEWKAINEEERSEDGATVRKWAYATFDLENKLQHTKNRYEIEKDGVVIDEEEHECSPATRWYSQAEAFELYQEAGFKDIQILEAYSKKPADEKASRFCVLGVKG